jgi:hypothetical protein
MELLLSSSTSAVSPAHQSVNSWDNRIICSAEAALWAHGSTHAFALRELLDLQGT